MQKILKKILESSEFYTKKELIKTLFKTFLIIKNSLFLIDIEKIDLKL